VADQLSSSPRGPEHRREELGATDVAVVIPTQNRWTVLERTVDALRRQSVNGLQLVVVVDDGAEVPPFLDGSEVVSRHRRGVAAARNAGVAATDRRIVLFLGDDTIPDADLIARHLFMHRLHPAVQFGVLGTVDWHPEVARGRIQRWLDWSGTQFDYRTITGDEAGWGRLYSSNVSLKRQLLLDVGGFDEDFAFGYEDTDLGLRLHAKGLRLMYEPAAKVWHVHNYDWPAIERRFLLVGSGEYLMVRKHPEFPPFFLHKLVHRRNVTPFSLWPWLVDYLPTEARRLRAGVETRADAWYSKRLAPFFVAGWLAAEEIDELGQAVADGREEALAAERLAEQRWLGEILPLVPSGGRLLSLGCSGTLGRELLASGYRLTFATHDAAEAEVLGQRMERRGLVAPLLPPDQLDPGSGYDAALAFWLDRAEDGRAVLDAAERHSRLVVATFAGGPRRPNALDLEEVLERARRRGFVLRGHTADGSILVVYRGDQRQRPPRQGLRRRLVGAAKGHARRLSGRSQRPWLSPSISGAVR